MPGATLKDAPITSSCYGITTQCIHHDPNKAIIFSSGTLGIACPPDHEEAAVRCCSDDDTNCEAPDAPLCSKTVTYYWAEQKCADSGRRLCHPSELRTNMCCKPGCGSGIPSDLLVWANKAKSMYI